MKPLNEWRDITSDLVETPFALSDGKLIFCCIADDKPMGWGRFLIIRCDEHGAPDQAPNCTLYDGDSFADAMATIGGFEQ